MVRGWYLKKIFLKIWLTPSSYFFRYHGRIACSKHRSVSFVENMKVFFSFPNLYVFYIFIHFWLIPIDDRGIFIEDHIPKRPDRSLTGSRFLSALYGMWSSTEIPLFKLFIFVNFSHIPGSLFKKNLKENKTLINKIAIGQYW